MYTTASVWAKAIDVAGNSVRQLLVPAGKLDINATGETVDNEYGSWPATREGAPDKAHLIARLPALSTTGRISWAGSKTLIDPLIVEKSYRGALEFRNHDEPNSLRRPQIGALHSILGFRASGIKEPGIVVMPTGTGKTETMLAVLVAARPRRVLVIVPTAALREQIASKFETLGILQKHRIVEPSALRPAVGRLEHGIATEDDSRQFVNSCNIIVATPNSLSACTPEAKRVIIDECTDLMVDEAHHSAAPTWASIIQAFEGRPTLLFTATPFREDGASLPGKIIFRFPLREAQRDGYYTRIEYRAILSLGDVDRELAQEATQRLRNDLAAGFDHILLARADSIAAATKILQIYCGIADDLNPKIIHQAVSTKKRKDFFNSLQDRSSRIIVCVDMLGEGFDLPQLKIGAIHCARKSLSPMIQLIGRFTRTSSDQKLGTASVFVARAPGASLSPVHELLREDADWNLLLHDITERKSTQAEEISEFESSFAATPDNVPITLIKPKVSAVVYRAPSEDWEPASALDHYGVNRVVGQEIAVGAGGTVAWLILDVRDFPRWGKIPGFEDRTFELILMYFDRARRLLYIHGSATSDDYRDLAECVAGTGVQAIFGIDTFRVFHGFDRLVPSNVGLKDVRDHFMRFSLFTGSDVSEALDPADAYGKSQTHIATSGFENAERTTISAAVSGRIWSMRSAANLKEWVEWCDTQGAKMLDSSIGPSDLFSKLIIPQRIEKRPPHALLGVDWPWEIYLGPGYTRTVAFDGVEIPMAHASWEVDDFSTDGPFQFSLIGPSWRVKYRARIESNGLRYEEVSDGATTSSRGLEVPLFEWLNKNKLTLFLAGDRMIEKDRYLEPQIDLPSIDRSRLSAIDWDGVNFRVESQTSERKPDSIQAFMSSYLRKKEDFDVLIDDDRAGEAADLVGLRVDGPDLVVTLVHCKYSTSSVPGARLNDLYEVCGQAIRSAKWRQKGASPLLNHLAQRARRYKEKTGVSPFEVGNFSRLVRLQEEVPLLRPRFHMIIAQPGLSVAACKDEHLRLFAGVDSYVKAVAKSSLDVLCSP